MQNHDDDDNTKETSKKSADRLLWPRNLVSESNYFRAIAIVRIVLKITWKILPGNLKILGFFYLKSLLRQCAGSQDDRAHRKTIGRCTLLFWPSKNTMSFIYEIKHVFHAFIAWWEPRRTFGRIREQISELVMQLRVFTCSRILTTRGQSNIVLTSFSCSIALWKHTCRPIKTHVLPKLFIIICNN